MTQPVPQKPSVARTQGARRGGVRGIAIPALLTVALSASGCGGGSGSTNSAATVTTITKTEFVAKANAICGSAAPVLSAATAKLATHPSQTTIMAVVKNTFLPAIESQITGIRALGTPSGDQATVTRMLRLVNADLNKLKLNPGLIITNVFGDFAKVAHPYGLTACAPLS